MPAPFSRKAVISVVLLAGLGGLGWLTYGRIAANMSAAEAGKGGMAGMAIPVEAALAKADTLVSSLSAVGSLVVEDGVILRPELSGVVTDILFKDGEKVSKGAALIRLDDSVYKAQVAQAEAQLSLAQQTNSRAQALSQRGAGTDQSRDEAASKLRTATAALALAKATLDKTVITAPFDGVVGIRQISLGDYVSPGQNLVSLQGLETMRVDFKIPETYLSKISVGQKLSIEAPAYPADTFTGTVTAIDPLADTAGRSVAVRATVPNPEAKLRPGLFANVKLVLAETPNTVFIPAAALWPMGDQQFVFKITDGKALMQPVTVAAREADRVAISSGLSAGDQVVTSGQVKLAMGPAGMPMPVMVLDLSAPPAGGQPAAQPTSATSPDTQADDKKDAAK